MLFAGVIVLAVWATPPGWLQPAHIYTIDALQWMQEHWLNAAAIATTAAVATVLMQFLTWRLPNRPSSKENSGQPPSPDQRAKTSFRSLGRVSDL
jgi:hypothetical protein